MTVKSEVLEVVREMPGIIAADVHQLMPHVKRQAVYAALSNLEMEGAISSVKIPSPNGTRFQIKQYTVGGEPRSLRPAKAKKPTDAAKAFMSADHVAKIAELEAWKAAAIARFPDLAVDPDVIKARKIVSDMLEKSGDLALAHAVAAGQKDETMLVRAVVAALGEGK